MMLPGGRPIDRFGPHNVAAVATAVWSVAQALTGAAVNFATMLLTRLGLGIGAIGLVTRNSAVQTGWCCG